MPALTPTIISNGTALSTRYHVVSIDIVKQVNHIANAEITVLDGSLSEQTFTLSQDTFFDLGNEIEIKLRYEGDEDASLFKGLVVKHSIEANYQGSLLTVALKDAAIKLTQLRKSIVHKEISDADIISTIIDGYGLNLGVIADTQPAHTEMVQYNCTDWDFLVMRAESQGLLVTVDDSTISAQAITFDDNSKYQFDYGMSQIHSFEIQTDALQNFDAIKTRNWDITNQEIADTDSTSELSLEQGNFDISQIAQTFGTEERVLHTPLPLNTEEMLAWVNGQLNRSRLARFKGRLTVSGIADIKPLDIVEIAGMGDRFNGKALVTGIRHRVTLNEGWLTDIQLGLSAQAFASTPDISEAPAAGLIPEVKGLHIGIIAEYEDDPDGEFRVKLLLASVGETADSIWARLATPDAGNGRGFFSYPEIGDEVVVGFFNDDPRQAVILGSLYSSAQPPFEAWAELTEDNFKKGFATRTGTKIEFTDEEKPKLRIETAAANSILLDDDAESLEIADQHGNTIIMNADGITITSSQDFIIDASGDIQISGNKVDIK
ncbi:MAG: Rhs element Vgr protein [Gammaproteobacteria bacterium]|nr:MAG: Rhs element Vgr protein [Gammaproteobacteria bacterium]